MTIDNLAEHTISILVYNKPGVLSKVMSLITRRGFNMESVSAEQTAGAKTRIIVAAAWSRSRSSCTKSWTWSR